MSFLIYFPMQYIYFALFSFLLRQKLLLPRKRFAKKHPEWNKRTNSQIFEKRASLAELLPELLTILIQGFSPLLL